MAQILFNFISPIRWIFMAIDSILFGLVDNCYQLIVSFANAELFTSDQISEIRTKIYFIITLVAFFRLAFLLINSLINPDKLTDEQEGLSKIAFNFVIMLILLVITPIIFNIALDLQKDIVNENVITGIFTLAKEDGYKCDVDQSDLNKIKRENYKKFDPTSKTWVVDEEKYQQDIEYKKSALCSSAEMKAIVVGSLIYPDARLAKETNGKYEVINDSACDSKCKKAIEEYNTMLASRNFKFTTLEKYIGVTVEIEDSDVFVYNYTLIITTICVGFMLYILLSFAFDLGKRLLEMNLLMILSPLFIATYVDPKSAKSGPFNNWLKQIGNTYAGLFLRLAALAVMMLFVKILSINKAGLEPIGPIGFIILLFAGLTFCKELPKWISGLLGMKEGGMGELGLGKKLGATPLLGGAAKKAGYLAAGTAGAAAAGGWNALKDRSKRRGEKGLGYFRNRSGIDEVTEGLTGKERRQALRDARRGAYARDGKPKNGGFFKQVGAGMLGSAIAGGRQAIKADNVKGAFQGSIKAADNFGKSIGNRGSTIKGWVNEKLDARSDKLSLAFGDPGSISADVSKAKKESLARELVGPTLASKVKVASIKNDGDLIQQNQMPIGDRAMEIVSGHIQSKFDLSQAGLKDEDRAFVAKSYIAASMQYGEANISGISRDASGNVTISLNEESLRNAGIQVPNGGAIMFDKDDKTCKGIFSETKSAALDTMFYEGQRKTMQDYAALEASLGTITNTMNSMQTAINQTANSIKSSVNSLPENLRTGISSAMTGREFVTAIDRALQSGNLSEADSRLLNQMKEQAEVMERNEASRSKLEAQAAIRAEEMVKYTYVTNYLPGADSEQKIASAEKTVSDSRGIEIKDDDKK